MKVRVLYEFIAQPNSGELSININDLLTVTRQDIGDGWWEGTTQSGQTGLFPAGYVEPVADVQQDYTRTQPELPPVPVQQIQQAVNSAPNYDDGDWGDDDWDDDDDSQASNSQSNYDYSPQSPTSLYSTNATTPTSQIQPITGPSKPIQQQTARKSFNRFSTFVKSGGEDYILGYKKLNVNQSNFIFIIDNDCTYKWEPNPNLCQVMVDKPKKETKMKGLKSFIAYQLTPDTTRIQVSRRYKHFDWLHERFQEKFTTIPIPALPDKQISGRYEDQFIEHRRLQLQSWVNRICKHPVLSQSDVWNHFLTCGPDEKKWKLGKRKAEKDELVGASLFFAIQPPPNSGPLNMIDVDRKMDQFSRFISKMDDSVKLMYITAQDQSKKFAGPYKREFSKIAHSFQTLADSFAFSGVERNLSNESLNKAIKNTSDTYEDIGRLFAEEPKHDFAPMSDMLHEYKGILTAWPEIMQVHKGAMNKKKEHQRMLEEGKIDKTSADQINSRADVVTFATYAEINQFQEERIDDFKQAMQSFLTSQIRFYREIAEKLEGTLTYYNF
ncbi:sorting nexin-33-like [Oppia nitens]|uniref:sorting nexin-33-like n=1 Tax=Oppia nitens TaxID=1686743 RepID=UPI0023DA250A|nr:sorting nexin-33-like [Oppia nitens]